MAGGRVALAAWTCPPFQVRNTGMPAGQFKNISGIETYHSYPPGSNTSTKAILFISNLSGISLLENRILADSIAANGYLAVMPDLFEGEAIDEDAGQDLTDWHARHPEEKIDRIINITIRYLREEVGAQRIGGVGYCFGGKYVPRFLSGGRGIDVGFIAHPSFLTETEIEGITNPISIAAGTLDEAFNMSSKVRAENILGSNNVTFQSNLYFAAPHGFAISVNQSNPQQAYVKEASFVQAVTWFNTWL
ncbi:hypothetical protein ASPVEDRAFT_122415 [Aspergillus versicolor CBS 583.65]|uniref:Dienelactone hydrolase domain-containing protein n=1 Tax=Aspergillus versicolor CBS 583.65 TaxID=1036611 RepID=A0A1L9P4M4_ASPVE|nr:uncharacterized protein ASPVEDRAFT_122415 [Aspergillus versicolor CBS 583.65]OJI96469.1 hypothetical protein ASPVEDRAFT_122415 [Aspergillus versicolor CBS 583.65]